ncbi:hypothetical protein ACIP5Z_02185 [Rothia terrae]|uniref:hypothetical protein n=1 Tax=Rothia terrae TaxID=396015 RepID=UPI00380F0820
MGEHIESVDCSCWGCIEAWEVRSRARDALTLLCREHPRFDVVEFGEVPPVEMSLIEQLRLASMNTVAGGGGGAGKGAAGLPFDFVASEMMGALSTCLHGDAVELGFVDGFASVSPESDGEALLAGLGSIDVEVLDSKSVVWRDWTTRIFDHLNPGRKTPIPGVCPNVECGADDWVTVDEDGGTVHAPALYAVWVDERVDHIQCMCCSTLWHRHELFDFARLMDPYIFQKLLANSSAED